MFTWFRRKNKEKSVLGESPLQDSLYHTIGYRFQDEQVLKTALTHRSMNWELKKGWLSNERLEFLGDAVLGLVVSERLYRKFPRQDEGDLTRKKSYLVSRESLATAAKSLGLGEHLILSAGEEQSGGRKRDSILADSLEAVIGALYIDGGLPAAESFISRLLLDGGRFPEESRFNRNYKSLLLEYVQSQGNKSPQYEVTQESGPEHKKMFTVHVRVNGEILGEGLGKTKKSAEQKAALSALEVLGVRKK